MKKLLALIALASIAAPLGAMLPSFSSSGGGSSSESLEGEEETLTPAQVLAASPAAYKTAATEALAKDDVRDAIKFFRNDVSRLVRFDLVEDVLKRLGDKLTSIKDNPAVFANAQKALTDLRAAITEHQTMIKEWEKTHAGEAYGTAAQRKSVETWRAQRAIEKALAEEAKEKQLSKEEAKAKEEKVTEKTHELREQHRRELEREKGEHAREKGEHAREVAQKISAAASRFERAKEKFKATLETVEGVQDYIRFVEQQLPTLVKTVDFDQPSRKTLFDQTLSEINQTALELKDESLAGLADQLTKKADKLLKAAELKAAELSVTIEAKPEKLKKEAAAPSAGAKTAAAAASSSAGGPSSLLTPEEATKLAHYRREGRATLGKGAQAAMDKLIAKEAGKKS